MSSNGGPLLRLPAYTYERNGRESGESPMPSILLTYVKIDCSALPRNDHANRRTAAMPANRPAIDSTTDAST